MKNYEPSATSENNAGLFLGTLFRIIIHPSQKGLEEAAGVVPSSVLGTQARMLKYSIAGFAIFLFFFLIGINIVVDSFGYSLEVVSEQLINTFFLPMLLFFIGYLSIPQVIYLIDTILIHTSIKGFHEKSLFISFYSLASIYQSPLIWMLLFICIIPIIKFMYIIILLFTAILNFFAIKTIYKIGNKRAILSSGIGVLFYLLPLSYIWLDQFASSVSSESLFDLNRGDTSLVKLVLKQPLNGRPTQFTWMNSNQLIEITIPSLPDAYEIDDLYKMNTYQFSDFDNNTILFEIVSTGFPIFNTSGTIMAYRNDNGDTHVVNTTDLSRIGTITKEDPDSCDWYICFGVLALSRDGNYLATAYSDYDDLSANLQVWDVRSNQLIYQTKVGKGLKDIRWSPTKDEFLIAIDMHNSMLDFRSRVEKWDITSSEPQMILPENRYDSVIEWSPDGTKFASRSRWSITIWDANTGKLLSTLGEENENSNILNLFIGLRPLFGLPSTLGEICLFDFKWSPNGKYIVSAGNIDSHVLSIWNVKSQYRVGTFTDPDINTQSFMLSSLLSFSPTGERLITKMNNEVLIIWDSSLLSR